ncbi:MAG: hypothetical protein IJO94_00165, partial [Firmicutes bacterium]|nr:hypothetical protein [Bacillota bacterium]
GNNEKKKPIYWKIVCLELLVISIPLSIGLSLFFEKQSGEIIFSPMNDPILMGWFIAYVLLILYAVVWWSSPALLEYMDYIHYEEVTDEIIFTKLEGIYVLGADGPDPISKFLKKKGFFRYDLVGTSLSKPKFFNVRRRHLRIICTPTKKLYLKLLFFPREENRPDKVKVGKNTHHHSDTFTQYDVGRSKIGYPLKVTYTKYNHYLLYVDLIDGIDYPENFSTLVKRANERE